MILDQNVINYIKDSLEETYALLETLARIPAPSHHEEKRAEFCKNWLEAQGAEGVYIDEALNVIYPVNCEGRDDLIIFAAHTDVVFPDTEELPFRRDDERFYAPGVGDDTVCLVMMLMTVKYIIENGLKPNRGILFVANSCEEGLGNLKGSHQLMKDFEGRVSEFYTFDGLFNHIYNRCVGSYRYEIECTTEGGHSYGAFGNNNAIAELAKLVCDLYSVEPPKNGESKTTFNVGTIEGGTSVNTIAQSAKMLYEYRSDDVSCINKMTEIFEEKMAKAQRESADTVNFKVTTVGVRPCSSDAVDMDVLERMTQQVIAICEKHTGLTCDRKSGSTDCNAPMSKGIPAVCVGSYMGRGAHTREESIEISSIEPGMKITAELILGYFE